MSQFFSDAVIDNYCKYHPPTPGVQAQYNLVRAAGRNMMIVIRDNTPQSGDQTAAMRKVREAMMTAIAAIACGVNPETEGEENA